MCMSSMGSCLLNCSKSQPQKVKNKYVCKAAGLCAPRVRAVWIPAPPFNQPPFPLPCVLTVLVAMLLPGSPAGTEPERAGQLRKC